MWQAQVARPHGGGVRPTNCLGKAPSARAEFAGGPGRRAPAGPSREKRRNEHKEEAERPLHCVMAAGRGRAQRCKVTAT